MWTCIQALRGVPDPRAEEILLSAHRMLREQAERIGPPAEQRAFLEDVAVHREIAAAVEGPG